MKRAHIFYSGTVQGVGFRYAAQRFASDFGLQGWVKNLADGRVEIMAEGPAEILEGFCRKLEQHFDGYIRGKQIDWQEPSGHFRDFKIVP